MTTALIIDVIVTDRYRDWVYKLCLWKSYVHIEEINLEYMIFNFPHDGVGDDGEAEDDDELLTDGNGAEKDREWTRYECHDWRVHLYSIFSWNPISSKLV